MRNMLGVTDRDSEARYQEARNSRLATFRNEEAVGMKPQCAVFLGSSTIERFHLHKAFPGTASVNRGIGAEPLDDMIERLDVGWPGEEVHTVVIYGGSADLRRVKYAVERIGELFEELLAAIKNRAPKAKVIVIEPLVARSKSSEDSGTKFDRLRATIRDIAEEQGAVLVETHRAPLVDSRGLLNRKLSRDNYHLNEEGYKVLAGWLREASKGRLN